MLINIGEEFVISTQPTRDGPVCHVTFPISDEDFEGFSYDLCLDNLSFVVDNDWRGEDE